MRVTSLRGYTEIAAHQPEVLCAVLLRELLWLEARMDVQALFEGSVVLSDEDGPGRTEKNNNYLTETQMHTKI